MTDLLPLFPLGTVLYPGMVLPLHIFEERYRQLMRDLLDRPEPREFGVIAIREGRETGVDGVTSLYDVGCIAELRTADEHEDGTFEIVTVGTQRFRLGRLEQGAAYLQAEIEPIPDAPDATATGGVQLSFRTYLDALVEQGGATVRIQELPAEPVLLSYVIAAAMIVELPEHQALLAAPDAASRLAAERTLLARETAMLRATTSRPAPDLRYTPTATTDPPGTVSQVASQAERATSFGAIAADYDRLRPSPADAAVEWLLPEQHDLAVDVAAGTGLLSRVMARQVKDVIAVELDHRMAAVLRERSPGVHVVQGRGEALPLADASADAVLISSAWHWLDPLRAVPEMARVLRPGGYLGLLRTGPERSWVNDLRQAREEDGSRRPPSQPGFPRTPLFGEVATGSFDSTRTMSVEDFVDLMATYSAVITASEDERAVILDRARAEVVQRFPGASHIDVPLRTRCWRVERVVAG